MADEKDFEAAGKRILLGLHRAGRTFAHGGGAIVDAFTGGQLGAAKGIDQFTSEVGLAYAELDALPEDSEEARYIREVRAVDRAAARQGVQEADRNLAQMGMPSAMPTGIAASELAELAALARQREMREAQRIQSRPAQSAAMPRRLLSQSQNPDLPRPPPQPTPPKPPPGQVDLGGAVALFQQAVGGRS